MLKDRELEIDDPQGYTLEEYIKYLTGLVGQVGNGAIFNIWYGYEGFWDGKLSYQSPETEGEKNKRVDARKKAAAKAEEAAVKKINELCKRHGFKSPVEEGQ
jgi:hypothetical protein